MHQKLNNIIHKTLSFNHHKKNLQLLSPPFPLSTFSLAGIHIAEMLHKKELFAETLNEGLVEGIKTGFVMETFTLKARDSFLEFHSMAGFSEAYQKLWLLKYYMF